ncbi:unnamed protein product (macronuclear) [Paramecium tetraurelia]|uniref:HTH psq-type domain-containing protein n=1 Tax=Paramecium tetraurelia TaxID=5888 RepID=A0BIM4_PARTE|nr:uncharacterized protein GSPATT00004763001 [Paramecium tetraurelia]CAK58391.1 unnamed protein product [Paramecium tetraurelia]|eukprot:XP_001425789.1 hypothetical protein (macronuclear) [Paramecium tetraurelia strain d4-2]
MIKIQNKVDNSQQPLQRQRLKIDQEVKLNLINSVINDHLPVYQAAKLHRLKYSSAKHIFRNYQRDTNNFFSKQRKRRLMRKCQNIIIDIATGEIKLFEQNSALLTNVKERIINSLNNQIVSILSKLLYQEINIVRSDCCMNQKHNLDEQLVNIKKVLNNQYQKMLLHQN